MAKLIAVTGGKGGTGKSTISISLAYAISKFGKVLLADADVECPNDHIITKIKQEHLSDVTQMIPAFNQSKCLKCGECAKVCHANAIVYVKDKYPIFVENQCSGCNACYLVCQKLGKSISQTRKAIGKIMLGHNDKITLISGITNLNQEEPTPIVNDLIKQIRKIKTGYDYIIVDTAPGIHCNVISALSDVNMALTVTEPTKLGAHDLSLILKLLQKLQIPKKIIINKADIASENEIVSLSKKFNSEIISRIKYSIEIQKAYSKGYPIKNKVIDELAEKLK